jgi:hypothetical protein
MTLSSLKDENLQKILSKFGYDSLYPIQEQAISSGLLTGENLLITSPTASGKTLIAIMAALKKIEKKEKGLILLEDDKLYYDNKITIAASGGGDDKVQASISGAGGILERVGGGKYIAKVRSVTDDCKITVTVDGKVAGVSQFRVRTIPQPVGTVGGFASGEVIGWGHTSADSIFHGWMNSPGHHDIIMGSGIIKIGVGWSGTCVVGVVGS